MDDITFEYNLEKNAKLLQERGVGFEDVIAILNAQGPLTVSDHPNPKKYPYQKIYVLQMNGYVYLVPFELKGKVVFLRTIYPSRKVTKLYQGRLLAGGEKQ